MTRPRAWWARALARRAGIAAGQTLELRAGDRSVQLLVTGIVSTGGQEDDAVLAPLAIAQQLSGKPGAISAACW